MYLCKHKANVMKHYASFIIFFALIITSGITSLGNYRATEQRIVADLNRALIQTIAEKPAGWITNDTIKAYRRLKAVGDGDIILSVSDNILCRHIGIPQLRDKAYICIDIPTKSQREYASTKAENKLCSDTVIWKTPELETGVALRSYAQCSVASVFVMSDQRIPMGLCIMALLWAAVILPGNNKRSWQKKIMQYYVQGNESRINADNSTIDAENNMDKEDCQVQAPVSYYGGLAMSADGDSFFNNRGESIRLTPMQHELLKMFFSEPDHRLSKHEICEKLWPKKDDASDTLYTLIKRFKPVIEGCSRLRIETERGRAYRLVDGATD